MDEWKRSVPEDTVEYFVYAFPQKSKQGSGSYETISKVLKDAKISANQLVATHLKDYIWQRDAFKLETKLKPRSSPPSDLALSHLYGHTDFSDLIEDEWLIVWLLLSISLQHPSLWIRLSDSTGEFLLVEAANVLPGWLDPDIAPNRVWLNRGQLRLIPVASSAKPQPSTTASSSSGTTAGPPSGPITLTEAQQYIYDERPTLHPTLVEQEALARARAYPGQIAKNQHHALLSVPRKLAFVLHERPSWICGAVDAFYLRDPIAMKPLMRGDMGLGRLVGEKGGERNGDGGTGLVFPPQEFVTMRVGFTRVGYAQVKSQQFERPPAWIDGELGYEDARFRDRAEMGMKVCAGFEMLLGDPQRQDERTVREIKLILEDVESGEVDLPTDEDIRSWGTEEDDEEWMNIDFRDFEDELAGKKERVGGDRSGFGDKAAQEKLRTMVKRFEDFLNDDTLDAYDIDDDDDDKEDDSDDSDEDGDATAPFTEDDFTKMMREMMGMPEDVMRELMTKEMDEDELRRFAESAAARPDSKIKSAKPPAAATSERDDDDEDEDEDEEIRQLTAAMEAELRSSGALDISDPKKGKAFERIKDRPTEASKEEEDLDDESDGELLDEDYNLVANMLESFKGQGGSAGPGGNLMGLLGVKMPRDESGSGQEEENAAASSSGATGSKTGQKGK